MIPMPCPHLGLATNHGIHFFEFARIQGAVAVEVKHFEGKLKMAWGG